MRNGGIIVASLLAGAMALTSCSKASQEAKGKGGGPKPVPVTVGTARTLSVPVELKTFGNVKAFSSVSVKAEVAGTLLAVNFKKGQRLKKGLVLFKIDPRSFKAVLDQAEATLARDKVQEANARKEAGRQADLLKKGIVPQTDYDKSITDADSFAALAKADEAAVETTRLQVERCTIVSPIDGLAGDVLVDAGNLVKADDVALVTINQISPVDVFFAIPQKNLAEVKKYMGEGKIVVKASIPEDTGGPEVGELTFVDNAVDSASGTIKLGATFENKDERLWPGQYVNVTVELTVQKDAVVAPSKAVQIGREGKYVYVIKEDNGVETRPVTVGIAFGDDTVIASGLAVGERVVTDGQSRLEADSKVDIKTDLSGSKAEAVESPVKSEEKGVAGEKGTRP